MASATMLGTLVNKTTDHYQSDTPKNKGSVHTSTHQGQTTADRAWKSDSHMSQMRAEHLRVITNIWRMPGETYGYPCRY